MSEETSEDVSEESSEEVSEETSEEVSEESSEEVSEESSEEVSEEETENPYGLPAEYVAALEATAELGYEDQIAYEFISGTCMDDGYYTFYTDSFSAFSYTTLNSNTPYTISTDTTNGKTAQYINAQVTVTATNATLQFMVQAGGAVIFKKGITINSGAKLTVKFHADGTWDIGDTILRDSNYKGALFNNNGTLIIKGGYDRVPNDIFVINGNNIDATAPAIFNNGTLTLEKVTIKNNLNKATNYTAGGLHLSEGSGATNTLNNVTITNCTATQNGGGIQHQSTNALKMTNVTIQNCSAYHGTAIMIPGSGTANRGALTATNCKFINNDSPSTATDGGGAIRTNGDTFCNATFTGCEFKENDSNGYGGAFYWNAAKKNASNKFCTLTIDSCSIHNNSAKESGGAIYCEAYIVIKGNTEIYENHASNGGGGVGVRSYINDNNKGLSGTSLVLSPGIEIYDNTSDTDGGGIWMYAKTSGSLIATATFNIQLNGAQVYNNNAVRNGGGIYMSRDTDNNYKCTVLLDYGELKENVSGGDGGGFYTENLDVTIGNNAGNELLITGNTAVHEGGAVYATGSGVICSITNGTLTYNTAVNGGALACVDGAVKVHGGSLESNSATGDGGAVYVNGSTSTFSITNGTITSNSALNGGALACEDGTVTVNGGSLESNSATSNGGAIYVKGDSSTFSIEDGKLTSNTATNGGALACVDGKVTVNGGKLDENSATAVS